MPPLALHARALAALVGLTLVAAVPPAAAHHIAFDPLLQQFRSTAGLWTPSVGGLPPVGVREQVPTPATPTAHGDCGPGAIREPALQGQVPQAEQRGGRTKQGYRCNLRLVGQQDIMGRGANFQLAWYGDCAYVGIVGAREYIPPEGSDVRQLEGIAVIDASDPTNPRLVKIIASPAGRSQHEGIEVNEQRGMLVALQGGLFARYIEVYDISTDCREPRLRSRYDAGFPKYHGLDITDDGTTIYASDTGGGSPDTFTSTPRFGESVVDIIDIADMDDPRLIRSYGTRERGLAVHDLELSADGRRAHLGTVPASSTLGAVIAGPPSGGGGPSMLTLDTSEIDARKASPRLPVVGELTVPNFGHTVQRARIAGKPYLLVSGETPFGAPRNCPWAWGHVADISDERKPREVAQVKLEVNEIANCLSTGADVVTYSIHYIGLDDERDARLLFYTWYGAGLRVFDVRQPTAPREIAYYHPPPRESTTLRPAGPQTGDTHNPFFDSATSNVRYRPETGHIWFVSIAGGFQILEFSDKPAAVLESEAAHPLHADARLLPRRLATVLRRGSVPARVRCSRPCSMRLTLTLSGRRAGPSRSVRLRGSSARTVTMKLDARAQRLLRRSPSRALVLAAVVRDRSTGRIVTRLRTAPRRLRR